MIVKKKGSLLGIRMCVSRQDGIYICAVVEFRNGQVMFPIPVYGLSSMIKQYDLAVPNRNVAFQYEDEKRNLCFLCSIWDNENYMLDEYTECFDDNVKDSIATLFMNVNPNVDVANYITCNPNLMNGFEIIGNIPDELKKEKFNLDNVWDFRTKWNVYESAIACIDDTVIKYSCSFASEGYNGPQFCAGYKKISTTSRNFVFEDYEYDIFSESKERILWDKNTVIELDGDTSSNIRILCTLENLKYFKGIANSNKLSSAIKDVIANLINVKYETIEKYRLPAREILSYIGEIEKMIETKLDELTQKAMKA